MPADLPPVDYPAVRAAVAEAAHLRGPITPRTADERQVGACACGDPIDNRASRCWGCGKEANR